MTFPVYFHVLGYRLHPHPVMEIVAYTGGFQLYLWLRRRKVWPAAAVPFEQAMWLLVGAVFGALFGSKLLAWTESWPDYSRLWLLTRNPPTAWRWRTPSRPADASRR
jgi:phosphatidylglycerol:prolipoprotein diacylglycerol transferase